MPTKDTKYISTQQHEVKTVCKRFVDANGEYLPGGTFHLIHYHMTINHKKVLRSNFYGVLALMGYKVKTDASMSISGADLKILLSRSTKPRNS